MTNERWQVRGTRLAATWIALLLTATLVLGPTATNLVQRAYTHGPGPVAVSNNSGTSYLHTDLQGSVREVTDAAGLATSQHAYEPFGIPRPGSATTTASGLAWAGQYTDPNGLSHLRARQYDPHTGAFQVPDPASTTAPGATYTYANSNPMTGADPLGLATEELSWGDVSYAAQNIIGWIPGLGDAAGAMKGCSSHKGACGPDVIAGSIAAAFGLHGTTKLFRTSTNAANGGSRLVEASAAAFRAADNPSSIFIKNKHLASSGIRGGKFASDDIAEVQGWVAQGLRSDGVQFLPNQLDDTFRAIVPAGRAVGTGGQTNIRVIVTNDGRVINAFPVNVR